MSFSLKRTRPTLFAAVAIMMLNGIAVPANANAGDANAAILVKMDRAKVMRIARPASMIIIGNTSIADATIKDAQTLIITGKQYGTTNLIVLDKDGEPIADETLTVTFGNENDVVIYKGSARSTYSCSPNCEPVFHIGDKAEFTSAISAQTKAHNSSSKGEQLSNDENE